jgi:hypothetical protein
LIIFLIFESEIILKVKKKKKKKKDTSNNEIVSLRVEKRRLEELNPLPLALKQKPIMHHKMVKRHLRNFFQCRARMENGKGKVGAQIAQNAGILGEDWWAFGEMGEDVFEHSFVAAGDAVEEGV